MNEVGYLKVLNARFQTVSRPAALIAKSVFRSVVFSWRLSTDTICSAFNRHHMFRFQQTPHVPLCATSVI